MSQRICFAFYRVGIRVRQAEVLCRYSGTLSNKATVLASMIWLNQAALSLLDLLQLHESLERRLIELVETCSQLVAGCADVDEYCLSDVYEQCGLHLRTLVGFVRDVARGELDGSPGAENWFELGLEVADGEGNTPWQVPPDHRPRSEPLEWRVRHPERFAELLTALVVCPVRLY